MPNLSAFKVYQFDELVKRGQRKEEEKKKKIKRKSTNWPQLNPVREEQQQQLANQIVASEKFSKSQQLKCDQEIEKVKEKKKDEEELKAAASNNCSTIHGAISSRCKGSGDGGGGDTHNPIIDIRKESKSNDDDDDGGSGASASFGALSDNNLMSAIGDRSAIDHYQSNLTSATCKFKIRASSTDERCKSAIFAHNREIKSNVNEQRDDSVHDVSAHLHFGHKPTTNSSASINLNSSSSNSNVNIMSNSSRSSQSFQGKYGSSSSLFNSKHRRQQEQQQQQQQLMNSNQVGNNNLHNAVHVRSLDELLVAAMDTQLTNQSPKITSSKVKSKITVPRGRLSGDTCGGITSATVTKTKQNKSSANKSKRSIVTYFKESFPFKSPAWQTDLTTSGSDLSEYGSEDGEGDNNHDDNAGTDDHYDTVFNRSQVPGLGERGGGIQKCSSPNQSLKSEQTKTGGAGSTLAADLDEEKQQLKIDSHYSKKQFKNDYNIGEKLASERDYEIRAAPTTNIVRKPKFGHWPQGSAGFSLSFGTTSTTDRATSLAYFSDDCLASMPTTIGMRTNREQANGASAQLHRQSIRESSSSAAPLQQDNSVNDLDDWQHSQYNYGDTSSSSNNNNNINNNQHHHHHHHHHHDHNHNRRRLHNYQQHRLRPVNIENIKCLIEENLVATLVGAYVLVSLAVIGVLVMPYVFVTDRSAGHAASFEVDSLATVTVGAATQGSRQALTKMFKLDDEAALKGAANETPMSPTMAHLFTSEEQKLQQQQQPPQLQSTPTPAPGDDVRANSKQQSRGKKKLLVRLKQMMIDAQTKDSVEYQKMWTIPHERQCQRLTVPFCSRSLQSMLPDYATSSGLLSPALAANNLMNYDKTLLPNQFTLASQRRMERVLKPYKSILDVRCYALMPLFLCSTFAPKCIQINATDSSSIGSTSTNTSTRTIRGHGQAMDDDDDGILARRVPPPLLDFKYQQANNNGTAPKKHWSRLVPPCRSVCREAIKKCTFFLEVLTLDLFSLKGCDSLPESSDENVCVGQKENLLLEQVLANKKCRNDEEFMCKNGDCIPGKWKCDGYADCSDKSDEQNCSTCDTSSQFYCGSGTCISKMRVCDGRIDCKDGRDERLCLRLSTNSSSGGGGGITSGKAHLRRLEAWNASLTSWVPVCGAHWTAMPMSHEACQMLGYSRANETLLLYDYAGGGDPRAAAPPASPAEIGRSIMSSSSAAAAAALGHTISYIAIGPSASTKSHDSRQQHAIEDANKSANESDSIKHVAKTRLSSELTASSSGNMNAKSLAELMRLGLQMGCNHQDDLKQLQMQPTPSSSSSSSSSAVYLSCQNFQCGRSVTSYLSRASLLDAAAGQPPISRLDTNSDNLTATTTATAVAPVPKASENDGGGGGGGGGDDDDDDADDGGQDDDSDDDYREGADADRSGQSSRMVVGGTESMPGEFPYLAALHGGPDETYFCGGVLIGSNWLLTAAHCVGNRTRPDGWMVQVGVTRRIASPASVKKLEVKKIVKHPLFNVPDELYNDIALIQLAESVEFNEYLKPICLPRANLSLGPDNSEDCVVVGFGKQKFGRDTKYLQVAHFASVPIVHKSICSSWYAEEQISLSDGMLCAGYSDGRHDACQGDSGSGLFCRHSNTNQYFVAGIVSFGVKCAMPRLPGIYTSVPAYVEWINEVTQNSGYPLMD